LVHGKIQQSLGFLSAAQIAAYRFAAP
jgi:hypothetical protein